MIVSPFEFAYGETNNNPLDLLEELADQRHWLSERINENLMFLKATGKNAEYHLQMEWDESFNTLQVRAPLDIELNDTCMATVAELFLKINETLWVGHFDLSGSGRKQPSYRHSLLLHTVPSHMAIEMIADLTEIAITECDRFYMTFKMLASGDIRSQDAFSIAMFNTAGEA